MLCRCLYEQGETGSTSGLDLTAGRFCFVNTACLGRYKPVYQTLPGKTLGSADAITQFPDRLHLGSHFSFILATASDSFCSILLVAGLATRWAALLIFGNILLAWALVLHFQFFAHGVSAGETMVLYLGGLITIALAGPGRFSLDAWLPTWRQRRSIRPISH